MTRMSRAQFKLDDIAEADIICHRRFRQHSGEPETDLDESVMDSSSNAHNVDSKPSVLTWRLPAWINLLYSTPRSGHRLQHRHPNPFGPQQHKDLPLAEVQPCEVRASERLSPQEGPSNATKCASDKEYPWNIPLLVGIIVDTVDDLQGRGRGARGSRFVFYIATGGIEIYHISGPKDEATIIRLQWSCSRGISDERKKFGFCTFLNDGSDIRLHQFVFFSEASGYIPP
jgi:hypothetical protein